MILVSDMQAVAHDRLRDAEALNAAGRFDGCLYLCGYCVEITLKARICQTLKWAAFPEKPGEFQAYKSFQTHDLDVLLHLSGVEDAIRTGYLSLYELMKKLETKKGPFTFFALFLREESPGLWDLVVSAPWLHEGSKLAVLDELAKELADALGKQALMSFSRIVTLEQDSRTLQAILDEVGTVRRPTKMSGRDLFGLSIGEAYIMKARRPRLAA